MKIPQIQTFCFFFSLKTGNIIIGSINALLSSAIFVVFTVCAWNYCPFFEAEKSMYYALAVGLFVVCFILALMFLAKFSFDIYFIRGVILRRSGVVKAYHDIWFLFLLIAGFVIILNIPCSVDTICMEVSYICVNLYILLLTYSYYKFLKTQNEEEV